MFIEVNFFVGCMVSQSNHLLQDLTTMSLINKMRFGPPGLIVNLEGWFWYINLHSSSKCLNCYCFLPSTNIQNDKVMLPKGARQTVISNYPWNRVTRFYTQGIKLRASSKTTLSKLLNSGTAYIAYPIWRKWSLARKCCF